MTKLIELSFNDVSSYCYDRGLTVKNWLERKPNESNDAYNKRAKRVAQSYFELHEKLPIVME
jgi:hypothetical protein